MKTILEHLAAATNTSVNDGIPLTGPTAASASINWFRHRTTGLTPISTRIT